MKAVHIVGARPQFIKYVPMHRAGIRLHGNPDPYSATLIHTGQHYDYGMSKVFFEQMDIPDPDVNLDIGSGTHGAQTGQMIESIEAELLRNPPDWVVVYGDTNSTLAGALAASKLGIRVAHVEAGLRSYNRSMPEELNRVVADHVSNLLFCPTETAVKNLAEEGIRDGVHLVGDVMFDALFHFLSKTDRRLIEKLHLAAGEYVLLTLHRPHNTDNADNLRRIFTALSRLAEFTFVFPVHPRTRKAIAHAKIDLPVNVRPIDPVGYLEMLALESNAAMILTDSGGVQKEAYLVKVPCITLREETEWVETVQSGWNVLVGSDAERIVETSRTFKPSDDWVPHFGDGHAADRILQILTRAP